MTKPISGRSLTVIAALLAMLAPFSIDTYLPSFPDIAQEFNASSLYLQQTMSFYLFAFALTTLAYGPLADSFGRRRVVLIALMVYVLASIGCWFAPDAQWLLIMRIGQGLSASAGLVVARAVIRDSFSGAQAQRVMAQVIFIFALAPAAAPIIGGWLHEAFGWRSVFAFLTLFGLAVWAWTGAKLPETLPMANRQSIHPFSVAKAYGRALSSGRFMVLVIIFALNFGGFFLYIAGSPAIIYGYLDYGANDFWVLFVPLIGGLMLGTLVSGRIAGRMTHAYTVDLGYVLMLGAAAINVLGSVYLERSLFIVVIPPAIYAGGLALTIPNLTLMALDLFPVNRGLASAVQGFVQMAFNGIVAGILVPLVALRHHLMTEAMLLLCFSGFVLWRIACRRHILPASAGRS